MIPPTGLGGKPLLVAVLPHDHTTSRVGADGAFGIVGDQLFPVTCMQHSGGNRGNLECQPLVQPKGGCLDKQPSTRALGFY